MIDRYKIITILIAEDDHDDRVLIEQAFQECKANCRVSFVRDGVELMQYLHKQGKYSSPDTAPTPDLILLDLNMPEKDGREALVEIKSEPYLRHIPVVVLTVSTDPQDILLSYDHGGAGFIIKPETFDGMLEVVKVLHQYWFETVELASEGFIKKAKQIKTSQSFGG